MVPTLLQIANFAAFAAQGAERFPRFAERMQRMYDRRYEQVPRCTRQASCCWSGTDAGTSIAHGDVAREAGEMARCMPVADVIAAATWRARKFLARRCSTRETRQIWSCSGDDPRRDVRVLAEPAGIMLGGLPII